MGVELQLYRIQIGCHAARVFRVGKLLLPDPAVSVVRCAVLMNLAILLGLSCGALIGALTSPGIVVALSGLVRAISDPSSSMCQCNGSTGLSRCFDMVAGHSAWGGTVILNISAWSCTLGEGYQWNESSLLTLGGDIEVNPGPPVERHELDAAMKSLRSSMAEDTQQALKEMTDQLAGEIQKLSLCMKTVTDKLENIQGELAEVKSKLSYHEDFIEHISDRQGEIDHRLRKLEDNIERQEQRSRRDNVILYNVPEIENESFEDSENKFLETVNSVLPDSLERRDIKRAHRIGKAAPDKTRPLIASMNRSSDKYSILRTREELKKKGVGVSADRTVSQRAQLREAREAGLLPGRPDRRITDQRIDHREETTGREVGGSGYFTRSTSRRSEQTDRR